MDAAVAAPMMKFSDRQSGVGLFTAVTDEQCRDRFVVEVPFCGKVLRWQVILDSTSGGSNPPDFVPCAEENSFGPPSACARLCEEVASCWCPSDPEQSLSRAVSCLLRAAHAAQVEAVVSRSSERMRAQVCRLAREVPGSQVWYDQETSRRNFVVPISAPSLATLSWAFLGADETAAVDVKLAALNTQKQPRAPVWTAGGDIMAFLASAVESLKAPLVAQMARQALFTSLEKAFGGAAEYDAPACTDGWFMLSDKGGNPTLVHVSPGDDFPAQQPRLHLMSASIHRDGLPMQKDYSMEYPYSPRWSPDEMANRIFAWATSELAAFANACKA